MYRCWGGEGLHQQCFLSMHMHRVRLKRNVWGRARDPAFLTSSQVILMLPIHKVPRFYTTTGSIQCACPVQPFSRLCSHSPVSGLHDSILPAVVHHTSMNPRSQLRQSDDLLWESVIRPQGLKSFCWKLGASNQFWKLETCVGLVQEHTVRDAVYLANVQRQTEGSKLGRKGEGEKEEGREEENAWWETNMRDRSHLGSNPSWGSSWTFCLRIH